MNNKVADNTAASMHQYLMTQLSELYSEREAQNIVSILFQSLKNWNRMDFLMNKSERLSESEILHFHFKLKELKSGKPIQYVLSETFFYGSKFYVSPSVLIPRPETEELVDLILKKEKEGQLQVLDIGTGSGCIPISIQKKKRDWSVFGLDVSDAALEVANSNNKLNEANVEFLKCDILNEVPSLKNLDVVISNPPYVLESDKTEMTAGVLDWEPHLALFVEDSNPLQFYIRITDILPKILKIGGRVYLEIHERFGQALKEYISTKSSSPIEIIQDLQGKDRIITFTYLPI
ncbi:MAG: peptide chain release factor N(5)-glutamine methyltransferase [Flavobacteriales bacterium]